RIVFPVVFTSAISDSICECLRSCECLPARRRTCKSKRICTHAVRNFLPQGQARRLAMACAKLALSCKHDETPLLACYVQAPTQEKMTWMLSSKLSAPMHGVTRTAMA